MSNLVKTSMLFALTLMGISANAMPVGVQMAMRGRAAAQAAVDAAFPRLSSTATASEVKAVLGSATDQVLVDNITDTTEYAAFREWAKSVGAMAVKESGTAWLSYALGAAGVVPLPRDGDLVIDEMAVASDGSFQLRTLPCRSRQQGTAG